VTAIWRLLVVVALAGIPFAYSSAAAYTPPKRVAILIFDGVEIIDYAAPYEVFGSAHYEVYTVARTKAPVTTFMGLTVTPKYDFSDAPPPDILLVPGGGVDEVRADPSILKWVRDETALAKHTLSVCNGALILADAGLLDGLSATTTNYWIPRMRTAYPKIHMVSDRRFVDNGKVITSAGLSAGIDGALHVIEVMDGKGEAQQVALGQEYDWHPDHPFVRAALADNQVPMFKLQPIGHWDVVSTTGDRMHWEIDYEGQPSKSQAAILDYVAAALQSDGKWRKVASERSPNGAMSIRWRFTGSDGKIWSGKLIVGPGDAAVERMSIAVSRL